MRCRSRNTMTSIVRGNLPFKFCGRDVVGCALVREYVTTLPMHMHQFVPDERCELGAGGGGGGGAHRQMD